MPRNAWKVLAGTAVAAAAAVVLAAAGRAPAAEPQEPVPAKAPAPAGTPAKTSDACVECHMKTTPGIVSHWTDSTHSRRDIGCLSCHEAEETDLDAWKHEGKWIATIVTPGDCGKCHENEANEFQASHHSKAGNILHSLDNLLAEVVEGHRGPFEVPDPHKPGKTITVDGQSFAASGCRQCHGSQVAIQAKDGSMMNPWKLEARKDGAPAVVTFDASLIRRENIARDRDGRPLIDPQTWPNTGIGRMNLDGSRGSCSACHSRHDFSARRARQPENCGKCHLGPDHPQKEIYEESKHGVAYRDLKDRMNLDSPSWVLGKDYSAAPTCATCHMSATRTRPVTHDPRGRIAWNNRPAVSTRMDTDAKGEQVKPGQEIAGPWQGKRAAMREVCSNCHAGAYVDSFFVQYDSFVELYNGKYGRPGTRLIAALREAKLITVQDFDDKVEWTWFYIWHHEGRRARHGASMMAPDYSHWHGTFEVAERWYQELVPEIREILDRNRSDPAKKEAVAAVETLLEEILARPEHRYGAGK